MKYQKTWEDKKSENSRSFFCKECIYMFPSYLQYSKSPPESLFGETFPVRRGFCICVCKFFMTYFITSPEKCKCHIAVFCECIARKSSPFNDGFSSPCSDRPRNYRYGMKSTVGSSIQILARVIF